MQLGKNNEQYNQQVEAINKSFKRKKALVWAKVAAAFIVMFFAVNAISALTIKGTLACPGKSKSKTYLLFVPTAAPRWDWSVCDIKSDSIATAHSNH